LIANGTWPDSDQRLKILPGRDPDQLRNVLEALAAVSYFVTAPIETLLRRESPNLPWGATLIVVTPLVTHHLLGEMTRLERAGRRLALVALDENWEPQPLPGIIVRQAREPKEQRGEYESVGVFETIQHSQAATHPRRIYVRPYPELH
jgi:hypothetical protein